jgi:hypothetical protein
MKPTCFTNTNTTVIKSSTCGSIIPLKIKFIMIKHPCIANKTPINKIKIMGVPPL